MTGATGETEASTHKAPACSAAVHLYTRVPTQVLGRKGHASTPKAASVLIMALL